MFSTKFIHLDLLVMPDDGKRRELVGGDLFVTPSPLSGHQRVVSRLASALSAYLRNHPIGVLLTAPYDLVFDDYDVLKPDLLFVLNERRSIIRDRACGPPDLVVEVLSPASVQQDRGPKLQAYARFGVPEYWMADPEQKAIEVCRVAPEGYQLARVFPQHETVTSPLLPGFSLRVRSIFG